MKIGTKVQIKDNKMSRAWGIANKLGVVTGLDPKGIGLDIVAVKLDAGQSICEAGISINHLKLASG